MEEDVVNLSEHIIVGAGLVPALNLYNEYTGKNVVPSSVPDKIICINVAAEEGGATCRNIKI